METYHSIYIKYSVHKPHGDESAMGFRQSPRNERAQIQVELKVTLIYYKFFEKQTKMSPGLLSTGPNIFASHDLRCRNQYFV